MIRQVRWSKATRNDYGQAVRVSKCGRFHVVSRRMASVRAGHWNARAYELTRPDGTRIGRLRDTLQEALDEAEFFNDPNWEP